MLILADYVTGLERQRFRRHEAFNAAAGAADRACIAPRDQGCGRAHELEALYGPEDFARFLYATELTMPAGRERLVLHCALDAAMQIVSVLADQPSLLALLYTLDPAGGDEGVLAAFGIDPAESCRAEVAPREAGAFLAPHEEGYAYFTVDVRGELLLQSWSRALPPVALHLRAEREGDRTDIWSRIGRTPLPPEPG
ncbi:hypothetical protein [Pseudoroseomonas cervicalis]|uniref:hypothetical protein n=1 Tax=Teichococcus cervicalis TaxID=204525 RepID=UPI0027817990|nr:hypothetical protein [Pseudoroseomonas cervicalis]MDQ1077829.1 hypothetical protein [Pseudoroseomonas cervicalis]